MTLRAFRACAAATLLGLGLVVLLFLPALASGGTPPKGATPTATQKVAPTPNGGPALSKPGTLTVVDLNASTYTARGSHPNETITYMLVISNTGDAASAATEAHTHVPANTTYVPNSAQVQGGGTLSVNGGLIQWTGAVADGQAVTITYQTKLPGAIGVVVSATAEIYDPAIAAVVVLSNRLTTQAPTGGPDPFGYTYKDSFAPSSPVAYSFVPTTTPASKLDFGVFPNDDLVTGPVPIGFSFQFYTGTYTQTYVNTNGLVMFGVDNAANSDNTPSPIPSTRDSLNFASCHFADLYQLDGTQGVWVELHGLAPNRALVITYRTAYFGSTEFTAPPALFQLILFETSNKIKCQYAQTPGPFLATGAQSAIGLVNVNGTAGLAYSFLQPGSDDVEIGPIENGLAVEFTRDPAPRPVFVTSAIAVSHNVHPGDVATVTVAVSNTGSAGGLATTLNNPIPGGTGFVNGSGHVVGGGVLNASGSGVHWTGVVSPGKAITVSFRLNILAPLGANITDTAVISDPQATAAVVRHNPFLIQVGPSPTGGPDFFGYTYKDSFAPSTPVTFSWIITTNPASKLNFNNVITADDELTGPVPLGFAFNFYGKVYTQTFISTNGLVSFGGGSNSLSNQIIPSPGPVSNFVSCLWMDLFENGASQGVWVETKGLAPNRMAVITYRTAYFQAPSAPPAVFQMILYEGSNQIKCQYLDMPGPLPASGGAQATIGLENADDTSGLQYFYQPEVDFVSQPDKAVVGPLENNLAILFKPGPAGVASLSASFKTMTPLVHAGERVTYTLVISNNGPLTALPASLNDPIPPGTTFMNGSAAVVGGGSLVANASAVQWTGPLAPGQRVTVTFAVRLPSHGFVTNTATLSAPQAVLPVVRSVSTWVQPATGLGVGVPSYSYADSYAPGIHFAWVLTTGASTHATHANVGDDNNGFIFVPIGFDFPFFDRVYSHTTVSTNGLVVFNKLGTGAPYNEGIPTPGVADNYATCFWDDQSIAAAPAGGIWYKNGGLQPNRFLAMTFVLSDTLNPSVTYQYQMILYENGRLKCQYLDMGGLLNGDGRFATIGLEGRFGNSGLQYFWQPESDDMRTGPVEKGLAIEFAPLKNLFLPLISK